jgi:hypothetical protein
MTVGEKSRQSRKFYENKGSDIVHSKFICTFADQTSKNHKVWSIKYDNKETVHRTT